VASLSKKQLSASMIRRPMPLLCFCSATSSLHNPWDDLLQEGVERGSPLCTVTDPKRSHLLPFLIKDQSVVVVAGPINAGLPHTKRSSLKNTVASARVPFYCGAPSATLS
jgi:hypothetical protein